MNELADEPASRSRNMLRSLKNRDFRIYFSGQIASLTGTWMSRLAMQWLVYRLTGSAALLGVVTFCQQFPTLFLSPVGGVLGDRFDRRKFLFFTQLGMTVVAFLLAVLTMMHVIAIWHIIVLSVVHGIFNALDTPTRQAIVADLIDDRADLSNAIALNASNFNAARLIGPALGGYAIKMWGEGICFLIDAITYLFTLWALWAMRVRKPKSVVQKNIRTELVEGVQFAFRAPPLRRLLMLVSLMALTGAPYLVLMPVFARDVLGGDSGTLGWLTGAAGAGALIGAIYLGMRRSADGLQRIIPVMCIVFTITLSAMAASTVFWLTMICVAATSLAQVIIMAGINTLIQIISPDDKRSRLMSLFVIAFLGIMPLGALVVGQAAERIGAPETVAIGALLFIIGALLVAHRLPRLNLAEPVELQK
jgi:MFS family permease